MMYNTVMNVVALISDIIESKEIADRRGFQEELVGCLGEINRSSGLLLSPYTVTLGDEFQAVYENGGEVLDHVLSILVRLFPVRFRFSISFGGISTGINKEQAIGMDGPVFHNAREGMDRLKKTGYSIIRVADARDGGLDTFNAGLGLAMAHMADWKGDTLRIFYDLFQGKAVKEIVPHYNLSQRGVYKLINRNKLWEYRDFFTCAREELGRLKG